MLVVCALIILIFVFMPSVYQQFLPISYLSSNALAWVGIALLIFAMIWVLIAQAHMQKSWRIGIDEGVKTDLVQGGLFKISRNPIFLGMRLMLLGIFLILPNALMLAGLIAGEILVQTQVRLEEEFLTRAHGASYLSYKKQVHRWI